MADREISKPGLDLAAWLQLSRVSAVPSTITNILSAYLIANHAWQPTPELLLLIVCSCLLYISGMILNDWRDVEQDRLARPWRPIVSGRISRRSAGFAYLALTATVIAVSGMAGMGPMLVAIALVAAIASYNLVCKSTVFGPVAMGGCRFLNILLGGSTATADATHALLGLPLLLWWIAFSLAVLITGLTWFARQEASLSRRGQLLAAAAVMVAGMLSYAAASWMPNTDTTTSTPTRIVYLVMLGLIALPILWRINEAVTRLQPASVQTAVRTVLQSLIFLDAAVCILASGNQLLYPLITALFVIPSLVAAKYVSST
jgi:4-hydroxybenzoate polyprenyltransferase